MAAYVLATIAAAILGFVVGMAGAGPKSGAVAGLLGVLMYAFFMSFPTLQRSHDMDWNGWTALLAFIPFVGLLWIFKSGTAGSNRYGAPPPANTLGVKIVALFLPAVAVIGIVAAIALPAYQGYVQKAKAAQTK